MYNIRTFPGLSFVKSEGPGEPESVCDLRRKRLLPSASLGICLPVSIQSYFGVSTYDFKLKGCKKCVVLYNKKKTENF